jgi:RNA polymerase sigma factor (sigma-70 family)
LVLFSIRSSEPAPPCADPPDDLAELARQALAGDAKATRAFLAAAAVPMLSVVRRVVGSANPEAEDVLQDALIGLLHSLPRFRGESRAVHFANRVALFTAMAARRRWRTRTRCLEDNGMDVAEADASSSPLEAAIDNRRRQALRRVLDDLPTKSAEVLAMHFILGYRVEEIAAALDVPVNTVWSRLRVGKEAFLRRIQKDAQFTDDLARRNG